MSRLVIILIASLALIAAPKWVMAEVVRFHGFDFVAEYIQEVDDQTVKVKVLGEESLVAKEQLPAFIASRYLTSQNVAKLDRNAVFKFVANAMRAGENDFAAKAITAILESSEKLEKNDLEQIQALEQFENFSNLAQQVISRTNQLSRHVQLLGWLLCVVVEEDFEWIRGRIVSFVYLSEESFKKACLDRYLTRISSSDYNKADALIVYLEELFGPGDKFTAQLIDRHNKITTALDTIKEPNLANLEEAVGIVTTNPDLADQLTRIVVKEIHQSAEQRLIAGQPQQALELLSWLDKLWRTPTTHELILKALKQMRKADDAKYINGRIADFLTFISAKDLAIKNVYLATLQLALLEQLKSGRVDSIEHLFARILVLRPDPDLANDSLRLDAIIALMGVGDRHRALQIYHEIDRPISWINQARLIFAGLFVHVAFLWAIIVAAILALVVLIFRVQNKAAHSDNVTRRERKHTFSASQPIFGTTNFKSNPDPRWQEYENLLREFGLKATANMTDIKSAYRKMVKLLHPDTNPNLSTTEQERFRRLTKSYATIIELRTQLGL